ncbi:MAG: glycosyltransferase [Nitrososphaeria archaeon]
MNKLKIAFISSFQPRICGIASFTRDLRNSVLKLNRSIRADVIALDREQKLNYEDEVVYSFLDNDIKEFVNAAKFINNSNYNVVSLQHEFGLYGGEMGEYILYLINSLQKPLVTTIHMIPPQPTIKQTYIIQKLAEKSNIIVALSDYGRRDLIKIYHLDQSKVKVIPHGAFDIQISNKNEAKRKLGLLGRKVLTSLNIIRESRGIDLVIHALPQIIKKYPETIYLVLGTDPDDSPKPNPYRLKLEELVIKLDLVNNVIFENRYIPLSELNDYLGATDIFLTPYRPPEQSSSGSLAYAVVAGKVCISSPYSYARYLLSKGKGIIVPWENSDKIAESVIFLFSSPKIMEEISQKAFIFGRKMIWKNVAEEYVKIFFKLAKNSYGQRKN